MLFNKYYSVKANDVNLEGKPVILNIAMILGALVLGWISAIAISNLKKTIEFLK
jgi:hypothetical protein